VAKRLKQLRKWWTGSLWLSQDPSHWPIQPKRTPLSLPDERTQSLLVGPATTPGRLTESSRFGSYWNLNRVTAWILRFVRHARRRRRYSGELDAAELMDAHAYWIRKVQRFCFGPELQALRKGNPLPRESPVSRFNPFLDKGYLRIGGRLQFADLSKE